MTGQVIAGRYELSSRLGVGGMSTVHLAFDRRLERQVAIKLLAEHLADDSQFVTRFRREALSVAQLVHPNIVQVFDFGIDEAAGSHYIVMEYVRGRSGAELLREHGHLPVDETLAIVTQACRGLEYAHRNGVVHRDVKPGNLLRAEDGTVKLADFGIAKALYEESSITQVGSVLGTAAYLAPEQAHGEPAGPRADLYALGVVTYQFLSGRLPYEASSLTELALKQQSEVPPRLDHLVPGVTPELAGAVERALAIEAADRFGSAEELRAALEDGARGIGEAPSAALTQRLA
ncbi:MAG TPA: protein kinase, partial [Solirubrobacteraceae bacterium]|nr:protein kinase [Solirubrobacteraceae bacterium]